MEIVRPATRVARVLGTTNVETDKSRGLSAPTGALLQVCTRPLALE